MSRLDLKVIRANGAGFVREAEFDDLLELAELCERLYPFGWARILDTAQLTIEERTIIRGIKERVA